MAGRGKAGAVLVAGLVVASLMKTEEKADGSVGEGTEELRNDIVFPILDQTAGMIGDTIAVFRDEAQRQGLNPAAVFTAPAPVTADQSAGDGELAPLDGIPNQAGG